MPVRIRHYRSIFSWLGKSEIIGDYTVTSEIKELDLYSPENFAATIVLSDNEDMGYALYRDPAFRSEIYSYYTGITGSSEIASAVIENAYKNGISFTLAFSLDVGRKRIQPRSRQPQMRQASTADFFNSISKSFPELRTADFFNIQTTRLSGYHTSATASGRAKMRLLHLPYTMPDITG